MAKARRASSSSASVRAARTMAGKAGPGGVEWGDAAAGGDPPPLSFLGLVRGASAAAVAAPAVAPPRPPRPPPQPRPLLALSKNTTVALATVPQRPPRPP